MEIITDEFKMLCGEIYHLSSGNLIFNCTLCEKEFDGFDEFKIHFDCTHETIIKEESIDETAAIVKDETMKVYDNENPKIITEQNAPFSEEEELPLETNFSESEEAMTFEIAYVNQDKGDKEDQRSERKVSRTRAGKKKENAKKVVSSPPSSNDATNKPTKQNHACTECDYTTNLKSKLVEHLRRHFNDRPFGCEFCDQRFCLKGEKNRHTARRHPEKVAMTKTQPREKLEQKALIKSLMVNLGDNKFQCKECSYIGEGRASLWYHVSRRHSTYKPYQCTTCPKTFYTNNDLNAHIRSHTGEKPFLCTECGNAYSTSSHLSMHRKRHNNIRDKECPFCQRRFFSSTHLQNHLAVHSDDRPFACDKCASTFKRKKTLSNHMKIHEKEHAYQCEICDAGFKQENSLRKHIITKHTMTLDEQTAN